MRIKRTARTESNRDSERRAKAAFAAALAGVLIIGLSCSSSEGQAASPCDAELSGQCGGSCSNTLDCPSGQYCSGGSCTADCTPGGGQCPSGSGCSRYGECMDGLGGGFEVPGVDGGHCL